MAEDIYKKIWELSPHVQCPDSYNELKQLTKSLIEVYDSSGRLHENPLYQSTLRKLSVPTDDLNTLLENSTCLVTGGVGCVGTALICELLNFDVKRIIILDNASSPSAYLGNPKVVQLYGDICDLDAVYEIFRDQCPDFVFHTAAQRKPGYAETHISETFHVNVLGTINVVKACERTDSVKQFVFSSTGKASRYFTNEVYAQTKKISEYMIDSYAKESRVKYSMVRFTHILDNSLMNIELEKSSKQDNFVSVHSPGKYVTAQNVKEAACLLLNALIYAEDKQCNFLTVRNLEWPVESLEMALYYIKVSGRDIPVIFKGNPPGYTEKFFRGQMDWSNPAELNLLINVYEYKNRKLNKDEDIIISHISPTNKVTLQEVLVTFEQVKGENAIKECLDQALMELVKEALKKVDKSETVKILNWGLLPKYLAVENATVEDYGLTVPLLFESLEGSSYYQQVEHLLLEKV